MMKHQGQNFPMKVIQKKEKTDKTSALHKDPKIQSKEKSSMWFIHGPKIR